MIKLALLVTLFIGAGIASNNMLPKSVNSLEKPISASIYVEPSLTYNDLLEPFTITRPFRAVNCQREFKIGDSIFAWGNYVIDHFELSFEDHRLNTTATKYRLLPSNDAIFIIRDHKNRIIGYLRLNHSNSLFRNLFKPIPSTTLFNEAGEPLLETKYTSPIGNFRTRNLEGKTISTATINGNFLPREFEVGLFHPQYLISNVPENLFFSYLQLHSMYVLIGQGAPFIPSQGNIPIENLKAFIEASYEGDYVEIMSNDMGAASADPLSIPEAWNELKETLKAVTPEINLSKTEKEAIASSLSERFENEHGDVDPQEILDAIHELSDEQKSVILEAVDKLTDDSASL